MRKMIITLAFVITVAVLSVACGDEKNGGDNAILPDGSMVTQMPAEHATYTPVTTTTLTPTPLTPTLAPVSKVAGPFSFDGSVIYEQNGIKITTAGLDIDSFDMSISPVIWLDIENSTDEYQIIKTFGGSVNDLMRDVVFVEIHTHGDGENRWVESGYAVRMEARSSKRVAISYQDDYSIFGTDLERKDLQKIEFVLTIGNNNERISDRIVITADENTEPVDITAFGTVVIDNDDLLMVIGEQQYDWMFGPYVYVYVMNRSEYYTRVIGKNAEVDGAGVKKIYYEKYIAPGKICDDFISMGYDDGTVRGFENLSLAFAFGDASTAVDVRGAKITKEETVTVSYDPQSWGIYENAGLRWYIEPEYNALITVETPEENEEGIIFSISETASLEAGGYEGAGRLVSIVRVNKEKMHEMLMRDMTGYEVFAYDEKGNYYLRKYPTDVRYERRTPEEMKAGADQWNLLCKWAAREAMDLLVVDNELISEGFGNTILDQYLARAAYLPGSNSTFTVKEYPSLPLYGLDSSEHVEEIMKWHFDRVEAVSFGEAVYATLDMPDIEAKIEIYPYEDHNVYFRLTEGEKVTVYEAVVMRDENIWAANKILEWYKNLANRLGVEIKDENIYFID